MHIELITKDETNNGRINQGGAFFMKKKAALALALILMLNAIMPLSSLADSSVALSATVTATTMTIGAGETITYEVALPTKSNVNNLQIEINYDNTVLEAISSQTLFSKFNNEEDESLNYNLNGSITPAGTANANGKIILAMAATSTITQTGGTFCRAKFNLKDGVTAGKTEISVTVVKCETGTGSGTTALPCTAPAAKSIDIVKPIIPATGISISGSSSITGIGSTTQLTVAAQPAGADQPKADMSDVTWESSNSSVASVANGLVTAKGEGTATITAKFAGFTATHTITVAKSALPGSVAISGELVYGQKLTAAYTNSGDPTEADVTFTWYRVDGENLISIGTGKEYTLAKEDIGYKVAVKATSTNYSGEVSAYSASTISKAANSASPAKPQLSCEDGSTDVRITNYSEELEYFFSESETLSGTPTFQSVDKFTGEYGKTYYVFARYKENDTHYAGTGVVRSDSITVLYPKRTLNVTVEGSGKVTGAPETVRQNDKITLTAKPNNNDYKLEAWEGTDGLADLSISGNTLSFTMGADNVSITAKFVEKPEVKLIFGTTGFTYDGNPHSPNFSVSSPESIAGMTMGQKFYVKGGNVKISEPTDAGEYTVKVTYTSSASSNSKTTTITQDFTISQAECAGVPAVPVYTNLTESGFDLTIIEGQEYVLAQSDNLPEDAVWADTITTSGLEPGTQYYVFTRVKETKNYKASGVVSAAVKTNDTYTFEVVGSNAVVANVRIGGSIPATLSASIKNTGSAALSLNITNSNAANFALVEEITALASGATETITLNTNGMDNTKVGTYSTTVTVNAGAAGEKSITFTVNVVAKEVAAISGVENDTVTFNGQAQSIDLSKAAVSFESKTLDASKLNVSYKLKADGAAVTAPRNAGTYVATITFEDDDYIASKEVELVIEKAEVELSGLAVKDKVYDGTVKAQIDTANAELKGVLPGTDVSIDFAAYAGAWAFNDKHVSNANYVSNTVALALTGADAANYTLINGAIGSVKINKSIATKTVNVSISVQDKVYNANKNDAVIDVTCADIISGDDVQFVNVSGVYESINAGDAVKVTVTYSVQGDDAACYSFVAPKNVTGKVEKALISATVTAPAGTITYDSNTKEATVSATGILPEDKAKSIYVLTYNGSADKPVDAGEYAAKAELTEEGKVNYTISTNTVNFEIKKADMAIAAEKEYSVSYVYTNKLSKPLSDLQLSPAGVSGKWSITTAENEILNGDAAINGDNIEFNVKSGLTAAAIGKQATLSVTFTPDKNYNAATATVKVTLAEDTYTTTIKPALPNKIKLGEALSLTGVQLVTKFGSGAADQKLNVKDSKSVKRDIDPTFSDYGLGGLGRKYIKFTDVNNAKITYTHYFDVVDVLNGDALRNDKPTITLSANEKAQIPFEGSVFAVYKSGNESALTRDKVTFEFEAGMNEQRVLNTIGTHKVKLTYKETNFDNTVSAQSTTITIVIKGEDASIGGTPSGNGFEITPVPDAGKDMSYNNGSSDVKPEDVKGTLDALEDGADKDALKAEEAKNNAFDAIGDDKVYEKIDLTDKTSGSSITVKDGKLQVTVPYPSDSDKDNDTFVIIIKGKDGKVETISPIKSANGLQFTIDGDVDFVIGWYPTPESDGGVGAGDPEDDFWNEVYWTLMLSKKGSVITANAGYYDKVPQGVLRAVNNSGNTLIINSAFGVQLVITPEALGKIDSYRVYYPISYLQQLLKGSSITGSGSSSIIVGVLMPTTGDDTIVTKPYSMTPATEGYMIGMDPGAQNAVINAADGDNVSVLDGAQRNIGAAIGGGMLIVLGLLAMLGAAYVTLKKRGN